MYRLISQKPDIDPCRTGAAQTGLPEFRGFFLRDKFSKLNGVDAFFSPMLYQIASLTAPFTFYLGVSADIEIYNAKWY